jgi:hypothetical protein
VASTTAALVVASGTSTTAPSLSIASASTTASGVVMLTNSTSTTSSVLAATATAVKTVADVANGAMQASGATATGPLRIGTTGSLLFEGSVDNGIRTTLTAANPTAARTITLPNETGTVVTSASSGVVTSTMILDGTIVNADINASASIGLSKLATGALPSGITVASANIVDGTIVNADINASAGIVDTKLATISTAGKVSNSATTAVSTNTANAIVTRDSSGNFSAGTITANLTGTASAIADNTVTSAKIVDGTIVNADVNASAAIAGTKIAPNFGSQTITTTGVISPALGTAAAPSIAFTGDTNTGIYSPGADQVAVATNSFERLRITSEGALLVGTTTTPTSAGSGAVVAQNRMVISSTGAGSNQVYAGEIGTITATTGTVVFKFKTTQTGTPRACFVRLAISNRNGSNTPSNQPAAEYAFQLHQTSGTVCTLNGATTVFEFTYVFATHFAFADLGSGECTVTLTNPIMLASTGAYRVEVVSPAGFWTLDSVTTT